MNTIKTINPANGDSIAEYPLLDRSSIMKKIDKGRQAFLDWRKQSIGERGLLMNNVAKLLRSEKNACAQIITTEMGKPISEANSEIEKCALVCEHYAEHTSKYLAERTIATERTESFVCYQPLGVIFAIMPWNYPFWQVFRFAAPNLMAGNAAILKHAAISCGAGEKIESLLLEAGFPQGVFQSVVIDRDVAAEVIAHPSIAGVTLTGSEEAGRTVAQVAGRHLKKVVMELGGSDPYLILEDADLDLAADCIVRSRLNNAGQVCIAAKRVLVDQTRSRRLVEKLQERIKEYQPADPFLETSKMGPLARADLRETLDDQVQRSIKAGARLVTGGAIPSGKGFYYPPTILDNVRPGMPAFDEELFGPVISITTVDNEAQAIAIANESLYGLGAAVFTRDLKKGENIARDQLEAGSCFVNAMVVSDPRLPFGGIKHSGYGRELSSEGIREFVNTKTVVVDS